MVVFDTVPCARFRNGQHMYCAAMDARGIDGDGPRIAFRRNAPECRP